MSELRQLYQIWREQLKELCNWKRPEHSKVLAWLMVAVFISKDVCLDRLGLYLPHEAKPESIGQQFRRWLKNKAIDPRLIYDPVARQLLRRMRCRRLYVQIDRVQIKQRQNVLMLSVRYRRRAIPLAWICLPYGHGSSNSKQWRTLLDHLADLVDEQHEVIILADREFGSVERMSYVREKKWFYAIRLKGNIYTYSANRPAGNAWLKLNAVAPEKGTQRWLKGIRLTKTDYFVTNMACAWAIGSKDPWFIATNLPDVKQALKAYARRFGCEELFSDLKKRGFNWEDSRIRDPQRFSRLLVALALLVVFLLTLGRQVRLRQLDLEITSPSHRYRLSLFQMARRWLLLRCARDQLPRWLYEYPFGHIV